MRRVVVGLALVVLSAACSGDESSSDPASPPEKTASRTDTVTYVAPGERYRIDLPSEWELDATGALLTAKAPDEETPSLVARTVPAGDADLDTYIADQIAASDGVDVAVAETEVAGASEARLLRPNLEGDGGRATLVAVDEAGEQALVMDLVWLGDSFTDAEAEALLTSVRLGPSEDADV